LKYAIGIIIRVHMVHMKQQR